MSADATSDINKERLMTINEQNLARVIAWVGVIDSKAQFILSIILVALAYSVPQARSLLETVASLWARELHLLAAVAVSLALGALCCLLVSFVHLVRIIYPKRKPSTGRDSLFFYETIAGMSASDFQTKMQSICACEVIDGLTDQTYNNAQVVKKKFDQLSKSIIWFLVGLGLLVFVLISHQIVAGVYVAQ